MATAHESTILPALQERKRVGNGAMSPAVEAAKEYAAGFAAGVATVITGHPFDTVKVRAISPPPPFHHFLHRNLSHSFVRRTDSLGLRFPLFLIYFSPRSTGPCEVSDCFT